MQIFFQTETSPENSTKIAM